VRGPGCGSGRDAAQSRRGQWRSRSSLRHPASSSFSGTRLCPPPITFRWGKEEGEYAQEEEASASGQEAQGQGQQAQQAQQRQAQGQGQQQQPAAALPLRDGHDFDPPGASPAAPLESPSSDAHGVDLVAPFALASADALATPYTNYTSGYRALLDYVWHDPAALAVARQLPCPPEQLLGGFIPSPRFPSDHLAVVYDLVPRAAAAAASAAAAAAAAAAGGGAAGAGAAAPPCPVAPALAGSPAVGDAAAALRGGRVVALPTDTLYGLAADAASAAGVAALRAAKRRAPRRPLAVAVADVADIGRYCDTAGLPPGLLASLLPGPVTVLLPALPGAPLAPGLLGGDAATDAMAVDGGGGADAFSDTEATEAAAARAAAGVLGVRVPQCEFARAVARALGGAVALSSANVSGGEGALELDECWCVGGRVRLAWAAARASPPPPRPLPGPLLPQGAAAPLRGGVRRRPPRGARPLGLHRGRPQRPRGARAGRRRRRRRRRRWRQHQPGGRHSRQQRRRRRQPGA
jgi:tRNA A37 threonylcarbamoyladenosine synthetase subunit TsaC/SUA5/YrdC